jgi:hypothetical protein
LTSSRRSKELPRVYRCRVQTPPNVHAVKRFTYDVVDQFAGLPHARAVEQYAHKFDSSFFHPGRPLGLLEDAQRSITVFLRARCIRHRPVTVTELLDDREYRYQIILSDDSISPIVRSMACVKSAVRIPKDFYRVDINAGDTISLGRACRWLHGGSSSMSTKLGPQSTPMAMR